MGLDCIITYNNGIQYSKDIPQNIAEKFNHIKQYGVSGFEFDQSITENSYFISFRGKAYSKIIQNLTGYSLYHDLEFDKLKQIYLKLEENLDDFEEFYKIDDIQNTYANTYKLIFWTQNILGIDFHIPSPYEIIGLKEIFKICYENKCNLFASY